MSKNYFVAVIAAAVGSVCAPFAMAQTAPVTSASAWGSGAEVKPIGAGFAVRGGSAPLEQALQKIIPAPYTIQIDEAIPRTMALTWTDQADWMSALKQAVAPMGLRILPNWASNAIVIGAPQQAVAAPVTASPAPQVPGVVAGESVVAPKTQPVKKADPNSWEVRPADQTLAVAFQRWGAQAQVPVIWDVSRDFPAVRAQYKGDFYGAIEAAMVDTRFSDIPLHACVYNNAVRIVRLTEFCSR